MSTYQNPARRYREVQVGTAAKDDLLLLLLDGGVRFAEGGLLEMDKGKEANTSTRNDLLLKAQRIVLELMTALNPVIGLEIYNNLQSLYRFTFTRLFEGNLHNDRKAVEEGIKVFHQIRDLWRAAVEKARAESGKGPERPPPNSTISYQG